MGHSLQVQATLWGKIIDVKLAIEKHEGKVSFLEALANELRALLDPTVTLLFWEDPLTCWLTAYGLSPFGDLSVDIPFSIRAAKSLGARKAALWLEPIVLHEFKKKINSY